jgi:hypothetical protein
MCFPVPPATYHPPQLPTCACMCHHRSTSRSWGHRSACRPSTRKPQPPSSTCQQAWVRCLRAQWMMPHCCCSGTPAAAAAACRWVVLPTARRTTTLLQQQHWARAICRALAAAAAARAGSAVWCLGQSQAGCGPGVQMAGCTAGMLGVTGQQHGCCTAGRLTAARSRVSHCHHVGDSSQVCVGVGWWVHAAMT